MLMQKLSTQPLKGFRDFTPEDWRIQKYIFDVWARVCERYGYQEYNGPVLESTEIYNKSGADVGTTGKELYTFIDKGGRNLALRPEMTPTVGRMIAAYGKNYPKPIRWYSIAQFFRAENPQRGRGREFFQLNFDLFGSDTVLADAEIIKMAIDIMIEYGATSEMFVLYLNNRKYMNASLKAILGSEELIVPVIRTLDRTAKVGKDVTTASLKSIGLTETQIASIYEFIEGGAAKLLTDKDVTGANELIQLMNLLKNTKYEQYIKFNPALARGFDYYTGMVFEVFDTNPLNNRAMFGGGRYDNLVDMFSNEKMSAVGCAPGDATARLFLESWGLLSEQKLVTQKNERYYLPILESGLEFNASEIAVQLRSQGKAVIMGLSTDTLSKALSIANKNAYDYVVIFGAEEQKLGQYKIKNMRSGADQVFTLVA